MNDCMIKFEQLHQTAKSHKLEVRHEVLAYRRLSNANLLEKEKKLGRLTSMK